jgi:hypothetical protein
MVGPKMTDETEMRIGLVDCGLPLCRNTWTNAEIVWEIDARVTTRTNALPECPAPPVTYTSVSKSPRQLLHSNPVDLLVIDHSSQRAAEYFSRDRRNERVWTDWLQLQRPARIVEIWRDGDVPAVVGLPGKAHRKKLAILGYQSQHQIVCATEVGGSVNHSRMIAIHTNLSLAQPCKDWSGGWVSNTIFRQPSPCQTCYGPSDSCPGPHGMCRVLLNNCLAAKRIRCQLPRAPGSQTEDEPVAYCQKNLPRDLEFRNNGAVWSTLLLEVWEDRPAPISMSGSAMFLSAQTLSSPEPTTKGHTTRQ